MGFALRRSRSLNVARTLPLSSPDWTAVSGALVQKKTIEPTVRGSGEQRDLLRVSVPPGRIRA